MKHIRVLALAMMCLLCASTTFAGVIGSEQLTGSSVSYTFTDPNTSTTYTEAVSPYGANMLFNGLPFTGYLACMDIANPAYVGWVYQGVWVAPTTFAEKEASWLSD